MSEKRVRGARGKKNKAEKGPPKVMDSNPGKAFGRAHQTTYDRKTEGAEENRPPRPDRREQIDAAAIFGFIDPDIQQYFKGVEQTLDELNFETAEGTLRTTSYATWSRHRSHLISRAMLTCAAHFLWRSFDP